MPLVMEADWVYSYVANKFGWLEFNVSFVYNIISELSLIIVWFCLKKKKLSLFLKIVKSINEYENIIKTKIFNFSNLLVHTHDWSYVTYKKAIRWIGNRILST